MPKRELVVVADDRARTVLPETIADFPVRVVDWHDADGLASIGDAALLVDVDLRNASKVQTVRETLSNPVSSRCKIVAIDRGNHFSEAQANGLGASDLLKRPLDIHALKSTLLRHFPQEPASIEDFLGIDQEEIEKAPGGVSIVSAAVALHRMFTALTRGRPLDVAKVT